MRTSMSLFSDSECQLIRRQLQYGTGSFLVTFRNAHGPTQLSKLWSGMMADLGLPTKCLSWWSGSGTIGLLECEISDGFNVYGQWMLSDRTELIGVMQVDERELVNIREGFESGNVASSAMRAIRIGETFDRD